LVVDSVLTRDGLSKDFTAFWHQISLEGHSGVES
jgi:hypothetical protein